MGLLLDHAALLQILSRIFLRKQVTPDNSLFVGACEASALSRIVTSPVMRADSAWTVYEDLNLKYDC
jgi:hypothetical protein